MKKDPYIEMDSEFDICPGCGQRLFRGAMRCTRCGRMLITLEEQLERIEGLKKGTKASGLKRLTKALIPLIVAGGAAYYLFSDRINGLVEDFLSR